MKLAQDLDYLLFDGAFGTYYTQLFGGETPCELACVEQPQRVVEIHKAYLNAGAMAIKTNTFAANTVGLRADFAQVERVIRAAWTLAQQAVQGTDVRVFANMGPLFCEEDPLPELCRIADLFLELGAVDFLLETAHDEIVFAVAEHIKAKLPQAFVITSFACDQDGYTRKGIPIKKLAQESLGREIDAFGLNCMCGPSHLLQIAAGLHIGKLMSIMPNSGYPISVNGRTLFIDNEQYFAEKMAQMYRRGVQILGGCCGTTPKHIAAAANLLKTGRPTAMLPKLTMKEPVRPVAAQNLFAEKLQAGKRVIAVELDPPFDADYSHIAQAAPKLRAAGADAVTIADSPLARPRASSFMLSAKIQREVGLPAIPHFTCRDQNMIGMKSVLLGGSIEGLRNVLVVTGDPVPADERRELKGVFSTNSYRLISYIQTLNHDVFAANPYWIGGALNVNSKRFEAELVRTEKKQEMGVRFFLTQPVFSQEAAERVCLAKQRLSAKILVGFMPIVSYRNAVFLNNEVGGIDIPQELMEQMRDQENERVQALSLDYCMELVAKIGAHCDGYYLMTPLKKDHLITALIERLRAEGFVE